MKIVFMIGLVTALSLQGSAHSNRRHTSSAQAASDTARQLAIGGAIRGRAIEVSSNRPMRRVVVSCVPDEGQTIETTTGADGRYEIKNLRAGRYTLRAHRSGYLASPARAKTVSPRPMPIDVAAGGTVENVDFKVVRAGAISGRIVDDFGDVVVNARVTARRWLFTGAGRRLQVVAATDTDDLGEYRLSDLTACSYHVGAVHPSSAAEAIRTVSSYRFTADYPVSPPKTIGRQTASRETHVSWAYFPGVPTAEQAQRVEVREGRDISGIDFGLAALRGPSVSGTVLDPRGRPGIDAMVTLTSAGAEPFTVGAMTTPARSPDGSFHFPWVWPGEYVLTAHLRVGRSVGDAFAARSFVVGGEDIGNLNLVTIGAGEPFRGRIRTDGEPADFSPDRLRVRLVSPETDDLLDRLPVPTSSLVRPDWTFELTRIQGLRLVRVDGLPADWAVKAVTLGKRTMTDALVEIDPSAPIADLTIILTNQPTELSGEVLGPDDERAMDYAVVAFASDRSRWPFAPRFVQLERPNQDGRFRIRGLAPGDYLLAAVEHVEETEWRDPEFLARLQPLATPVTVKDGARASITLRLVGEERR